ncbi:MAG: putative esterase [Frankiales bacterium]|nr:putative esterase [Frankiales bacterium]
MVSGRVALASLAASALLTTLVAVLPTTAARSVAFASETPTPTASPVSSPSDTPTATMTPTPSPAASPVRSHVEVITLPSTDRGRTSRVVRVYRPAVADSPELPVLYLLHGQYGTPADPFNAGMQGSLDALFSSGVAPFVVAVPDGDSKTRSDDEWGDAADRADLLETFLSRDVLPAVEGANRRDRAHRAVAGFSMGGYAAVFSAQLHAASYGQVVALAGYFHPDDPQGVFPSSAERWAHYPIGRAWALDHTRVLLLDCTRETDPVIRGDIYRMRDALTRAGHPPGTVVTPGSHGWTWVQSLWPRVARFLAEGWAQVR